MIQPASIDLLRSPPSTTGPVRSGQIFAGACIMLAAGAALLAGWAPLGFSMVTVFLFAGPHNWMELRYFLSRLPGRMGPLRGYFLFSFAGVLALTAMFTAMPWLGAGWNEDTWLLALALWNSALLIWLAALVQLRSRQRPRRDWSWTLPAACLLMAVNWHAPAAWDLGLVYLHPLIALWILDRELLRSRPAWRPAYHACLSTVPLFVGLLWWQLASTPNLPGADILTARVTQHAGAEVLQGVSTHLLVATHAFLEMLHYGVWVIAIPLIGLRTAPWRMDSIPLTWRSASWRLGLGVVLILGVGVVLMLWACFLANYPLTRDVYFTVAMVHVLAEAPFLFRML